MAQWAGDGSAGGTAALGVCQHKTFKRFLTFSCIILIVSLILHYDEKEGQMQMMQTKALPFCEMKFHFAGFLAINKQI